MHGKILKSKPAISLYLPLFAWWLVFTSAWGLYRLLGFPEFVSEVIAKPIIWLGITALFLQMMLIPYSVISDLRTKYSAFLPIGKVWLAPTVFIIVYFFIINIKLVVWPPFSWLLLLSTIVINFSTGIVEEIVYRGVMYVWLLQKTDEVTAFVLVQILFVLGHLPVLLLHSDSLSAGLAHAFFIILIGMLQTFIFKFTRSIYASSLSHGIWNTLVYYLLIS